MSLSALKDIGERVLRTAAQAALSVYGLDLANVLDTSNLQKAAAAAGAAALAAVFGLVGARVGSSRDDASVR